MRIDRTSGIREHQPGERTAGALIAAAIDAPIIKVLRTSATIIAPTSAARVGQTF